MKKIIVITGGAGFVGSNLIEFLVKKTNYQIISLDNYSSGHKKNHIKHQRVKYFKSDTKNISKTLNLYKKNIVSLFHFGEFSRIYQSFLKLNDCINSNSIGTHEVFNFCLKNKIKLIYSATSASIGNKGNDKNLSPYAFTKAKTDMIYLSEGVLAPGEVRAERGLNPEGVAEVQETAKNANISGGKDQDKTEESERTENRSAGNQPSANPTGDREE